MNINRNIDTSIIKQIAESPEEGFMIFDPSSRVIYQFNDFMQQVFEEAEAPFSSTDQFNSVIHPDDKEYFEQNLNNTDNARHHSFEFRTVNSRGLVMWWNCKAYLVVGDNGERLRAAFFNDITNDKDNRYYLLQVNERKNTALHILGHDLRTPIAAIMAANSLIQRSIDKQTLNDINTFANIIKDYCTRATGMIENILDTEYLQSNEISLNKRRFELITRISIVLDTYQIGHLQSGKLFYLEAPSQVYIEADDVKFMLVIENLINNAYKFTKDDGIITIRVEELEDSIQVTVKDNGIGIPDANKGVVFDKFSKASRNGTEGQRSVGLGLHIVKSLVEMHHGEIWFESQEGVGSSFFVKIPQSKNVS